MAQKHRQRIGRWGESTAARFLEEHGYQIVARNARTPYGEIDLIARQEGAGLVFVEVKTRTNQSFGYPEEAVDSRKREHTFLAAQAYLVTHPELAELDWRIDVIAILGRPGDNGEQTAIEHFENIGS